MNALNILEKAWVVIPAAGIGQRYGDKPKQYLQVINQTILEHTIEKFYAAKKIVVALSEKDAFFSTLGCASHPKVQTVIGGATRAQSVTHALVALKDTACGEDWVIVHDAVRPCLATQDLNYLVLSLKDDPVGGILATPVKDTLKEVSDNLFKTVSRENLWQAQTPQMFRYELLLKALAQSLNVTDEAQAIEILGLKPQVVAAQYPNPKLTYAEDLPYIEWLLKCE